MKRKRFLVVVFIIIMLLVFAACSDSTTSVDTYTSSQQSTGQIYLYGEHHGVEKILEKELELWNKYYHEENMRHLFVEVSSYTAEFLNLWMKSDSDDILEQIYKDWEGTASHSPYVKEFYQGIKSDCPETIFHGTDVGHQYHTTGQRFLAYLEENNLGDTEEYFKTQRIIDQGKQFYNQLDHAYRENMMVENFISEFDKLNGESIMGIYGAAHTNFDATDNTNSVPCMAKQLKERYGDNIHSEDLSYLMLVLEPIRIDRIKLKEKDYEASYFGEQDLTGFKDNSYREFWRLENAYEDFKDVKKTGDVLPYNNYPMPIEIGQVFVMDLTKIDGSVERVYYRSDGYVWNGLPATEEFIIE